ncbi:flagellar hook-basal body complex protein FliE [Parasulfuritortus cantonensis]|uniref:Flagellar hook-basal body complex protein FliE n=1 Tax=Parasulfuritortus cantonensis TaxID=2528202 RepID=A0A4R1BGK6_9PROT|nr:flagellar hook-basal body complex protein FliE [Parasulfuritortus cantonensis]TCJ16284.1 flagellar hook-basal body complex protein FliE [Parasulfuritortus cantonensis]
MVNPGIEQMVNQLRAVASQAAGNVTPAQDAGAGQDFSALLQAAVAEVNNTQQEAKQLSEQYAAGDAANLQDVVVSLQKASLSFQAMVQVRNKLVSAYQEVMNMQV